MKRMRIRNNASKKQFWESDETILNEASSSKLSQTVSPKIRRIYGGLIGLGQYWMGEFQNQKYQNLKLKYLTKPNSAISFTWSYLVTAKMGQ